MLPVSSGKARAHDRTRSGRGHALSHVEVHARSVRVLSRLTSRHDAATRALEEPGLELPKPTSLALACAPAERAGAGNQKSSTPTEPRRNYRRHSWSFCCARCRPRAARKRGAQQAHHAGLPVTTADLRAGRCLERDGRHRFALLVLCEQDHLVAPEAREILRHETSAALPPFILTGRMTA